MSWNDGITKELADYFAALGQKSEQAIDAIQEQIDIEAEVVRQELEKTAPRGATLSLLNSLTKVKLTKSNEWYGYSITFEGQNSKGVPYQKIANILNYGTSHIQGTRFISRAIRNLKGMDGRIAKKFEEKMKE